MDIKRGSCGRIEVGKGFRTCTVVVYRRVGRLSNFLDNDNRSSLKIYIGGKRRVFVHSNPYELLAPARYLSHPLPTWQLFGEQLGNPALRDKVCLRDGQLPVHGPSLPRP